MSPRWEDVNARARGLGTRLLRSADLRALAAAADLPALAARLDQYGIAVETREGELRAESMEGAIRRWAGRTVELLARWVGPRADALPLVFDEEDRRSIRALVRGAVARIPAERRLFGLLPTPALPVRALEELAALPTVEEIAALLALWRHPFAGAVEAAKGAEPDLPAMDRALAAAARARAEAAARRSGSGPMRRLVRELFADPSELPEDAALRERIVRLTRQVRQIPLEPLTTLWVALRLRGQVIDLQRIVWSVALGAPRGTLAERWISVAA